MGHGRMGRFGWKTLALVAWITAGCDSDPTGPPAGAALFEIEVSGERFWAAVTDTAEIRRMDERRTAGTLGPVSGELRWGNGGFNGPWGWHMAPATVHVADVTIELCDGRPSMVQEDLTYWVGTVQRFCPWGARVVSRMQ